MNEDRATRYQRLRRWATVLPVILSSAVLGLSVPLGVSHALRDGVAAWTTALPLPAAGRRAVDVLACGAAAGLLCELVMLPFAFYRDLVLDRRYGLSGERTAVWVRRRVQMAIASVLLIAGGLLAADVALALSGDAWWMLTAAVASCGVIVAACFAPDAVASTVGHRERLAREPLAGRLAALARRAGMPYVTAYEWKGASCRASASLVGFGRTRCVLLSEALLRDYGEEEVEVVFAHELAHHAHGDMWKTLLVEIAAIFGALAVADWALAAVRVTAALDGPRDLAGLPILIGAAGSVWLARLPLLNALSRRFEHRADRYALVLTGRPEAFLSAVRRLAAQSLAEERPSRLVELLFHGHPPAARRTAEVQRMWANITD